MKWHLASVWETIADAIGEAPAIANGDTVLSWREYEDRAARIASALVAAGIGADSKVGILAGNGNKYLEAQFGVFKVRGVPLNFNYRTPKANSSTCSTTPMPRLCSSTPVSARG
ncbi:MAG TPA: AMP-binding protein [Caulobacteraceae bacterium]|nr:AMP-binding protein [Caulobacteraceae bacterium]